MTCSSFRKCGWNSWFFGKHYFMLFPLKKREKKKEMWNKHIKIRMLHSIVLLKKHCVILNLDGWKPFFKNAVFTSEMHSVSLFASSRSYTFAQQLWFVAAAKSSSVQRRSFSFSLKPNTTWMKSVTQHTQQNLFYRKEFPASIQALCLQHQL